MRLHTNVLTRNDLREALSAKGMRGVHFYKCEDYGSMSRQRAFEVRLEGLNSNRLLNFADGFTTAATWDEWGIFLGELFRRDPHMVTTYYKGREDFRLATLRRFDRLEHIDQHRGNHRWDWHIDGVTRCSLCGAGMRHKRPTFVVTKDRVLRLDRRTDVERFIA